MDIQMIDEMRSLYEMTARAEGYAQVKSIVIEGPVDYKNDPALREMERDGWEFFDENRFGQGSEIYTCVIYIKPIRQKLISTLREGDYVKVQSNKPTFHLMSCYLGMDIIPEEISPSEIICIVNYLIDDTCCNVTSVAPRPGCNFVACEDEIICKVDPDTLTDEQRRVLLNVSFTDPNSFDIDKIPETEDTRDKCITVAARAVGALFPEADLKEMEVMSESSFSHIGLIGSMDFFMNMYASLNPERKDELTRLRDEAEKYIRERNFKDFYEVHAMVGESCWMIPVSYDFKKACVCRNITERTRFRQYLGGEYQDAADEVNHFMDVCSNN